MILINLLPYREERRKRRKAAFFAGLGLAGLRLRAGGVGTCAVDRRRGDQLSRTQWPQALVVGLCVRG